MHPSAQKPVKQVRITTCTCQIHYMHHRVTRDRLKHQLMSLNLKLLWVIFSGGSSHRLGWLQPAAAVGMGLLVVWLQR